MKPGDLIQIRTVTRKGRLHSIRYIGVLLEPPQFPRYGNFPMRYTLLTRSGVVTLTQKDRQSFEVLPEAGHDGG